MYKLAVQAITCTCYNFYKILTPAWHIFVYHPRKKKLHIQTISCFINRSSGDVRISCAGDYLPKDNSENPIDLGVSDILISQKNLGQDFGSSGLPYLVHC